MTMEGRHHKLLCVGLSTILTDTKFSDFQIRTAEGTSLPCHKVIMAAVSPFFDRMLENDMRESQTGVVDLPFGTQTVTDILAYIYSGSNIIKEDNIADVYYAANFLAITSLVKDCEEFLKAELPARVSLEIWQIAKWFDKDDIVEISKSKVLQDFNSLCNTDCMSTLNLSSIKELLSDSFLNCSGTKKCTASWLWVSSHDTNPDEVEQILNALVKANNVECDDIICACANEANDELDKHGDDLLRAQEMWTNACDKLWIKPSSFDPKRLALVPHFEQGCTTNTDVLVFLDEDTSGLTRLTFFDYRKKTWHKMGDVPGLELGHGYSVCSDGSLMYISGGKTKSRNQRRFIRLDCGSKTCNVLADMPVGRDHHTMCIKGRYLYVLGGISNDERYLDDVHKYSLAEDVWSYCGKIALAVSQHSSVTVGSQIYLLGGCLSTDKVPSETVQYYDTAKHISGISHHPNLTVKCKKATTSMTVAKDNIYFLFHGDVYTFGIKKGCQMLSSIDGAPQKGFAFVSFEGKILVIGGEDGNFRTVTSIIQYDCETNKAVKLPLKTPWPLQDFTCVKLHVPSSWSLDDI